MIEDILLEIFNRMAIHTLDDRHKEEKTDYICQDGKITKVIRGGLR